jgi:hypothetical protein
VTNHAVVAMVGSEVKQTRCTTCDADHEYKHARVPKQRRKTEAPEALYAQVLARGPKRPAPDVAPADSFEARGEQPAAVPVTPPPVQEETSAGEAAAPEGVGGADQREHERADESDIEEGPVHRPLIRATLPRPEGQPPPARPAPDFTIRQPGGRNNRFRPRHPRGGGFPFQGNRPPGNTTGGALRGGPRQGGPASRASRRHGGQGRKRSK